MSGTASLLLTRQVGVAAGLYWTQQRPLGSDLYWRTVGLDAGLEYWFPGPPHVRPFVRGGIGFREVALVDYYSVRTGRSERIRWSYDEAGNPVELRVDAGPEYTTYEQYFTEQKVSFVWVTEVGIRFPFEDYAGGDATIAPEIGLRYVRYRDIGIRAVGNPPATHRMNLSSFSMNVGFKILF